MTLFALLLPLLVLGGLHFTLSNQAAEGFDLSPISANLVHFSLFASLFLGLYLIRRFLRHFLANRPPLYSIVTVFLLAFFATAVTYKQVPAKHRVQSDEAVPMAMAQNMAAQGIGGSCDHGIFTTPSNLKCEASAKNFKGKLQASLYRWSLPFNQNPTSFGFGLHLSIYFLSILLMWSGIWLWSKNSFLALVSSTFMAFTPMIMIQFRSLSVEPLHVFLSLLAINLMHFCWYHKSSEKVQYASWLAFALVLGLFAQTRQESGVAALAFILPSLPILIKQPKKLLSFSVTFTVVILPIVMTILAYRGFGFQGGDNQAHSIANLNNHIKIAWEQMTLDPKNELLITPFLKYGTYLSLLGLILLLARSYWIPFYRKAGLFCLLFGLQAIVILENVSGDMTITINQRYTLVVLPMFAFFIAVFFHEVFVVLSRYFLSPPSAKYTYQTNSRQVWIISLVVMLVGYSMTYMHRNSFRENIMYKNIHLPQEQSLIHDWMPQQQSFYIYNRPWHFIAIGQSATDPTRFDKMSIQKKQEIFKQFQGRVYYIRGLDCWDKKTYHRKAKENRRPQVCDRFENRYSLKKVHSTPVINSYQLEISQVLDPNPGDHKSQTTTAQQATTNSPKVQVLLTSPSGLHLKFHPNIKNFFRVDSLPGTLVIEINHQEVKRFETMHDYFRSSTGRFEIQKLKSGIHLAEVFLLQNKIKRLLSKEYLMIPGANLSHLSDLPIVSNQQGWGELQKDRSILGNPLTLSGTRYPKGLGAHASSTITFNLPEEVTSFQSIIGIDDEESCGDGAVFEVLLDGKNSFKSEILKSSQSQLINLTLNGASQLTLKTYQVENDRCDHTNWVWPLLRK